MSLEERVEWAELQDWAITKVGEEPLINKWWMDADKPWQFLRACIEYVKVKTEPEFVSHLPITVDGSCNGLQHFSAMLRDEVGGKAVNLTMTDDPQDIYEICKR